MTKDEALRMALEALHGFIPYLPLQDEAQCGRYDQAITAIKEALAQPEQEPVAWITKTGSVWKTKWDDSDIPLYTTPPQRTWVGLTTDDWDEIRKQVKYNFEMTTGEYAERVSHLVEAKLKEKNT